MSFGALFGKKRYIKLRRCASEPTTMRFFLRLTLDQILLTVLSQSALNLRTSLASIELRA